MKTAPRRRGRFIAIEGIDGVGKSTLLGSLANALRRRGLSVGVRREPSDPRLGRLAQEASVADPWTGATYFTLDRYLARPALDRDLSRHDIVLADRSFYSTLAYQGSALPRGARRKLERLQIAATRPPDLVIWIELSPVDALARLGRRGARRAPLERRTTLERVDRAYRALARRHRWAVLDGRASPRELLAGALDALGPVPRRPLRPRRPGRR